MLYSLLEFLVYSLSCAAFVSVIAAGALYWEVRKDPKERGFALIVFSVLAFLFIWLYTGLKLLIEMRVSYGH